jgi:glutathione S-transferase
MKLYYSKGACSLVVRIIINELKLQCDFISVDLKEKKTKYGDDYFKINPKGAVPAIQIDSDEVITENAVIQQYLADTNHADNLLPSVPNIERYRVLQWLNYIATDIHKGFGPYFNSQVPDQLKKDIFIPNLIKKFEFINNHLLQKDYLLGSAFTLPDAYLYVMLYWAYGKKFDLSKCAELKRYFAELNQRPSVQQSILQEELDVVVS